MSIFTKISKLWLFILPLIALCIFFSFPLVSDLIDNKLLRNSLVEHLGVEIPTDFVIELDQHSSMRLGSEGTQLAVARSMEFSQISIDCTLKGYTKYDYSDGDPFPVWKETVAGARVNWEQTVCFKILSDEKSYTVLAINQNKLIFSHIDF